MGEITDARASKPKGKSTTPTSGVAGRLARTILNSFVNYGIVWSLVALMFTASFLSDAFFTYRNQLNILRQVSINGVLALGMTFVIIAGGIDLSVGGVLALAGVIIARLQSVPLVAFAAALLVGLTFGLASGVITAKGKVQAFIVTLGASAIADGLALLFSNGRPIFIASPVFKWVGSGDIFFVPVPVIILLLLAFTCHIVLSRSVFGTYVYAIGGNPEAARLSGINTVLYTIATFALSGIMAGVGGIIMVGRITTGDPSVGAGLALDAIAATVIGGTRLGGGVGTISGTLLGAFIIGVLNNVFNILNVSPYYQMVAKGVIIIGAVYLGLRRSR